MPKPAVFRQCPRCSDNWPDKEAWEKETSSCGHVEREHSYILRKGKESTKTVIGVQLDVRRHRCGGEMYNEGVVIYESTHKYSLPAKEIEKA